MEISHISRSLDPRSQTIGGAHGAGMSPQEASHWYAIHTASNHEKTVAGQLALREVEHFFPAYDSLRRWKDRKVHLQLPLFPGYLFARIALRDRFQVLRLPGVARLVGPHGSPAAISEDEIARVRELLHPCHRAEPHPYLRAGRRVCVVSGPLQGLRGIILRRKNGNRFVISMDLIQRSMAIEVSMLDLRPADSPSREQSELFIHA